MPYSRYQSSKRQKIKSLDTIRTILLRKQVWVTALILLVALCCLYFYRDLRLDVTTKFTKLPDTVVHDVNVDKVINGRRWKISAPTIKTEDNVVYGYNVDVVITEQEGTKSYITSKEAVFSRDYDELTLRNAKGSMFSGTKNYTLETGKAEYNTKSEVWNLSEKFILDDKEISVSGDSAVFDTKKSDCSVKSGGKISWRDE